MEKLVGDLLLRLKFVKQEILPTSFLDFNELGEFRSGALGPDRLTSVADCCEGQACLRKRQSLNLTLCHHRNTGWFIHNGNMQCKSNAQTWHYDHD